MLSSFIDISNTNKYVSHIFYLHSWTEKVQLQGQADHLGCVIRWCWRTRCNWPTYWTIFLVVTTSTVHRQHIAPLVILTTNQPVSCSWMIIAWLLSKCQLTFCGLSPWDIYWVILLLAYYLIRVRTILINHMKWFGVMNAQVFSMRVLKCWKSASCLLIWESSSNLIHKDEV
jgi:hypothetical protein